MTLTTYDEENNDLQQFLKVHHGAFKVETTPMKNNQYMKTYLCEDGATFYEVNSIVYEKVEVEVKGIKIDVKVKLFETEYWSTDDSTSKYVYSKAD